MLLVAAQLSINAVDTKTTGTINWVLAQETLPANLLKFHGVLAA